MPTLSRSLLDPTRWPERELLRRALRRDERAWTELVRRYRPLIYRCITKVTGRYAPRTGGADIDEIYADVMIKLVRDDMHRLRRYDPARGTKLGTWIGMIAAHAAYDFLRASGRRPLPDPDAGAVEGESLRTPLDELIDKERWSSFEDLLSEFTARDRAFVHLYYEQGLGAAAIAARMSISLKTVYTKKHKIRAHLQRSLARQPPEFPIADLEQPAA